MKKLTMVGCAALMALLAGAEEETTAVPTNTWIGATGGAWNDAANWSDPDLATNGAPFFAVFTNATTEAAPVFAVTNTQLGTWPTLYGLSYAPPPRADGATNTMQFVCPGTRWNDWLFKYRGHEAFGGVARLDVAENAQLTFRGAVDKVEGIPIEKRGAGLVQFQNAEPNTPKTAIFLRILEGVAEPLTEHELVNSEVTTQDTGRFRLVCDTTVMDVQVRDGANARSVDLNGHTLSIGRFGDARTRKIDTYTGVGALAVQDGGALTIATPQSAEADLILRNADLALKGRCFGRYTFDDSGAPWANAYATGLAALEPGKVGAPTVVEDPKRGRVAFFNGGNALRGTGANGALDYLPQGSADYTVAFWMKVADGCASNAGLFFWGTWYVDQQCTLLRVGRDQADRAFVYTHFGKNMDITADAAFNAFDGAWHHIAVRSVSNYGEFWIDGVCVQRAWQSLNVKPGAFNIGWGQTGGFKGWIDDFTVVGLAVDPATLMAEDFTAHTLFPRAPVVRYEGGGALASDGGQPLAGLESDGVTGTLDLTGDQTLAGTGAAQSFLWHGAITGTGTVVKTGADAYQVLAGPQTFTGDLRVEAGTLELRPLVATQCVAGCVARWTFDDATEPGRDASGNGCVLTAKNGARVVTDDVRGAVIELEAAKEAYLVLERNAPCVFPTGAVPYSIVLWMRPTAGRTANDSVWFLGRDLLDRRCDYLRLNGTTGAMFTNWGNNTLAASETDYHDGAWHHVAKTYDGTTATLYVDGVVVGTKTDALALERSTFYLGHRLFGDLKTTTFDGRLDDVRVYSYALSAEDVAADRAGTAPTPRATFVASDEVAPAPLARWTFDDADAPYASTGTGGAFTLTAMGGATVSTADDQRAGGVLDLTAGGTRYLTAETIPEWMPTKGSFTVAFWLRPKERGGYNACFYYGSLDSRFHLVSPEVDISFRYTLARGQDLYAPNLPYCGAAARKWTHVTCTYDAMKKAMRIYFDGACRVEKTGVADEALTRELLYIGRKQSSEACFYGWMDDVCVWGAALTPAQVRAHCAAGIGRLEKPLLAPQTDLVVDDGATFALDCGARATAATLTGAGTVRLAAGTRLALDAGGTFDGTVTGAGTLALAGGALTRTDGAAVQGSVALAEGISLTTDAAGTGLPVVTAAGTLTLPATGTLTFTGSLSEATGRAFVIARGATVTAPNGLAGWTATSTAGLGGRTVRFAIEDNAFTARVVESSMVILIR